MRPAPAALIVVLAAGMVSAAESAEESWQRAMELSDRQRYDESLRVIRDALARHPEDIDLIWLEAGVLGWSGRNAESVQAYEKLLERRVDLVDEVGMELARQRLWAGDAEGALRDAEVILAENAEDREAAALRAKALAHLDRHRESIAAYDELLRAAYDDDLALDRALVLGWAGRNREAAEEYRSVLARDAGNRRAKVGLARSENWRGRHRIAADLFAEAAAEKADAEALEGLVLASYWADRPDDARTALAQLAERTPESPSVRNFERMLQFEGRPSVRLEGQASDDSDDQRILTQELTFRQPLTRRTTLELGARRDRVRDPVATRRILRIGAGVDRRYGDRWRSSLRLGALEPDDSGPRHLVGSASASFRPRDRLAVDFGVGIEPVLTRPSLDLDIRVTTAEVSVSAQTHERVTLRGGFQVRDYSDGNRALRFGAGGRRALATRGAHRFALGFDLDLLVSDEDLDNGYYDPEHYLELGPNLEWAYELSGGTTVGARLRVGIQAEKGQSADPFSQIDVVASVPLGRAWRLEASAGRSDSNLSAQSGFELTRASVAVTRGF